MAFQPEVDNYDAGVYQLEQVDPVIGGLGGVSNSPLLNLANRTTFLKNRQDIIDPQVTTNTADIATNAADIVNLQNAIPSHLRHTMLAGPIDAVTGVENALQLIGVGSNRIVGIDAGLSGGNSTFAFSDGYSVSGIISARDFIKYTSGTPGTVVTLPAAAGTYLAFIKWNEGPQTFGMDYASSQTAYTISPTQPTVGIQLRHIWYNPAESSHYFTIDTGGVWTKTILIPVGLATVDGGASVSSVTTFDYQAEPYDTQTPVGSIIWLAQSPQPTGGWLLCDGSTHPILEKPRLAKRIGTTYGTPAAGLFTLPDLRGEFIRGLDLGRGIDTGRVIGTNQSQDIQNHDHALTDIGVQSGAGVIVSNDTTTTADGVTGATGGTETRPRNIALVPFIKY